MVKHIEIAKKFVRQQLQERDDIVGVLLVGSAARGETTEFSDVDLRLIVEEKPDKRLTRDGLDTWVDGVYIDATVASKDAYSDVKKVLSNPTSATDVNSAIILYDPTGFLERTQQETQAVFMQPEWVGLRLKPLIEHLPRRIDGLQEAIETKDPLQLCVHLGRIVFGFALIALLQHGVSPSSTRNLIQLGNVSLPLKQRLCELEGSVDFTGADVLAALAIIARLSVIGDKGQWGELPGYMLKKAEWMVGNGFYQEAIHATWINSSFRTNDCLQSNNPEVIAEASELVQEWLGRMSWAGEAVLAKKLKLTTEIWQDIEASVSSYLAAAM